MVTENYYIIAGVSILCLLVNLLHLCELDLISKTAIKKFRFLAYYVIFEIIVDTLFKAIEGNKGVASEVLYVLKAVEFAMNPALPFLILRLFNKKNSALIKWFQRLQFAIVIINLFLQIITIFGKFMFYIDENNLYQRTSLTIVYAIILILSTAIMVCSIYIFSHKVQNASFYTLCGLCLMLSASFTLRFIFANSNFDWLCISISFIIIDIYYVDLALRLDPLTHLLNRQIYSTMIERVNYSTAIIMIDVNNLKIINDTYGHECGDKTLQSIAKCIFKAYSEYGWCFRIGGDEFCVLLKPEAFKKLIDNTPHSDVYKMVEKLMEGLDAKITERANRDKDNYLQYGVAQGYGIYYAPTEYPSILDNMPMDKVLKVADERMYQKKAEYKKNLAKNPISSDSEDDGEEIVKRPKFAYESGNPELIENSGL